MSAVPQSESKVIEVPYSRKEEREGTAIAPLPVNATPMQMLAVAMNRGMDAAGLKDIMDLELRWSKQEAEKAYNEALAAFKNEVVEIIKRKRVNFTNSAGKVTDYKHAELADVIEAVGPALSRHGFAWGWKTRQEGGAIEVTCELRHKLGHMETVTLSAPPDDSGGKNKVQQIISTVTYLERHTLKAACGVSEKGEDSDGAGAGGVMSAEEIDKWVKAIEATTTKAAAKEKCIEAVTAAEAFNDLAAYQTFKDTLKKHGEFIEQAGK